MAATPVVRVRTAASVNADALVEATCFTIELTSTLFFFGVHPELLRLSDNNAPELEKH